MIAETGVSSTVQYYSTDNSKILVSLPGLLKENSTYQVRIEMAAPVSASICGKPTKFYFTQGTGILNNVLPSPPPPPPPTPTPTPTPDPTPQPTELQIITAPEENKLHKLAV